RGRNESITKIKAILGAARPLFRGFPKATSFWPLLLILTVVILQSIFLAGAKDDFLYKNKNNLSFGGPVLAAEDEYGLLSNASVYLAQSSVQETRILSEEGALIGDSGPLSNISVRGGLKRYKVRKGDTLSSLAADFGLGLETLRLANPELRSQSLKVGQELVVLPVSGILYEVKDGDALASVALRYHTDPDLIRQYNPDYQKIFTTPGENVILPYAKPLAKNDYINRYVNGLLDLKNYFVLPARGWNWGELHEYNAVDIADQCGKPIYASAEGLVIPDEKFGEGVSGWNNGYGLFVLIEHPNGTRTRYAHNGKNLVKIGDYVSQGQEIALIGNTGNTDGPSGCHLHFEVYGARNPFAVK
ncbi:MAG: peptidoglycan DD-metalloendopeptidase family protein, partial [Patescibacteria group bacterium]